MAFVIEHVDGTRTPVIDASVHIFFPSNKDLRAFLREPFKSRGFPDYEMDCTARRAASTRRTPGDRTASIRVRIRN